MLLGMSSCHLIGVHTSEVGEPLQQKYAWAVPSNAAIKVLSKVTYRANEEL